jgi:hypothetical protein
MARRFLLRHLHDAHGNREFMHLLFSPHIEQTAQAFRRNSSCIFRAQVT